MAIKCFVPECTEDVIGQCAGLENEPCGHFYCSKHSRGKLCDECAAVQKKRNLIQTYINAAESVLMPLGCGWTILVLIISIAGAISALFFIVSEYYILGTVLLFITFVFPMMFVSSLRKRRLNEKCAELRNFKEFYRAYKKQRNKEQLRSFFAVSLAITADMLSPEVSTASDIRRIRKRLE